MKPPTFRLFAPLVFVGMLAAPAYAQGVAGEWELTIASPQGEQVVNLTLKADGPKLTGDLSSQMGTVPITGTATGNAVAVVAKLDVQGMTLEMGINGTVAGPAMNGNVKVGDFGEFPFTGKRMAAKSANASPSVAPAAPPTTVGGALNAAGKWDVVLSIAGMGEVPVTAVLNQEGDKVTGTLGTMGGVVPVAGTVTGNALKLDFKAETPQGAIDVVMTGEATADGMKGKATLAGVGEADWTAKRSAQQ
jgi:hypothetical protein